MTRRYTVVLSREPDGSAWNVVVPALPGCFTWGATVDEALAMAREAITVHLDGEAAADFPIPEEEVVATVVLDLAEEDGVLRACAATPVGA